MYMENTISFVQTQTGNIVLSLATGLPGQVQASLRLTGPSSDTNIYLCSGAFNNNCGQSSITFSNMAPGNYSLTMSANSSFDSYTFQTYLEYGYQGQAITTSGINEFFYQGFEDFKEVSTNNNNINVVEGKSYAGQKFWNGASPYIVPFLKPNNKQYIIKWWSLSNNKWKLNSASYSNNMSLVGKIDEIRLYPTDAQMTTYTYSPLIGITSKCDPAGHIIYYSYDGLGRLSLIKDQDDHILKKIEYGIGQKR